MWKWIAVLALGMELLGAGGGVAQGGHAAAAPDEQARPRSELAKARYPQAVLVGDLFGRQVIENVPQQRVLGRATGLVQGSDDRIAMLVEVGGVFGFGTRRVAVPVEAMALLGPFIVALELNAQTLSMLPPAGPGGLLPAGATVRIGLARN